MFSYFFDHFDQTLNAERLFKKKAKKAKTCIYNYSSFRIDQLFQKNTIKLQLF